MAVLAALYAGSVASPPPPSERALATAQLLEGLVVPWAWWVDRNGESQYNGGGWTVRVTRPVV